MINRTAKKPDKIAIFRALQLGDMLCAIPAIRALKNAYRQSEIMLVGLPWAESFAKRFSDYFSGFICFRGAPGLEEQPFNSSLFIDFLQKTKEEEIDLLIQMHGNGSVTNIISAMLGAKEIAGYYKPGNYCPHEALFMPYPEGIPEPNRHLQLMEFLGISPGESNLEFPVTNIEKSDFRALCDSYALEADRYVVVHPGARDEKRWWAPKKFALVADWVAKMGFTIVFTGTEKEREVVENVATLMGSPSLNLVGKTNIGQLALLIQNARMLLSNDTGVSHIATAVQTPSVVIFLTSDPTRWAPLNKERHHIILPEESDNINYVISSAQQALQYKRKQNYSLKAG